MYFGGLLSDVSHFQTIRVNVKSGIQANATLPSSVDHTDKLLGVRNQGQRSSCVAFATCAAMEYQLYKNTGQKEYFSPDFIYTERENKGKQGMSFYNALSIAKYSGNVAEFRFPYQPKDITSVPDSVVQEASSYKITDFDRLDSITELKQALVNNGVCMVLFPIYHPAEAMFWLKKEHADQPVAYHGLAIVGYNDNKSQFKIRNSWGNKWNGDGYTYWNYKDYSSARELWTLTSTNGNRLPQQPVDKGNKCKCVLL